MISLNIGQSIPSFDQPLELLQACHGKILHQCDTLRKLAIHLAEKGCDGAAQQAAQSILNYFDNAGRLHHQDEELDLFTALRASVDRERLDALLGRLLSEHIVIQSSWNKLRPILLQIANGSNTPLPEAVTEKFIASHTAHISIEEAELLPLAASTLSPQQLVQLGHSMTERRRRNHTNAHQA